MNTTQNSDTFTLAITMAGAGSAGCYTAGVMDYLFEVLDLWDKAKKGETLTNHSTEIPSHKIVIEAMGGCSAGAMTTAMSAIYALNQEIKPVRSRNKNVKVPTGNIFYDCWVLMEDDNKSDNRSLFEKVLDTGDLQSGKVESLLNSDFIDIIADRAFNSGNGDIVTKTKELPDYISKDLQLLISHCFLRGIPLEVNFETPISKKGHKSVIPNHTTFEHYLVTHYHLNQGIRPDAGKYLFLNPYKAEYADILKLAIKASGAFPVGLLYRKFGEGQLSDEYIKTTLKRTILGEYGNPDPDPEGKIDLKYVPQNYTTLSVDGGAINNEPYREVLSILKDKYGEPKEIGQHKYGVIMIDPFPDRAQSAPPYDEPMDLVDIVSGVISTLTDQSRIKRREILEADESKYFRSIIFPRKWILDENGEIVKPEPVSICCASGMAFGGFLDINFREHDFFLGRNNARNFIRYFFSFPYIKDEKNPENNVIHPIHQNWTPEMVEAFKIVKKDSTIYLPIIPDLNILREKDMGKVVKQYDYDIPHIPKYDPTPLLNAKGKMKKRFLKIINVLSERDFTGEKEARRKTALEKLPEAKREKEQQKEDELKIRKENAKGWLNKSYKSTFLDKTGALLLKPFIWIAKPVGKRMIAGKVAKLATKAILDDLAEKDFLIEKK